MKQLLFVVLSFLSPFQMCGMSFMPGRLGAVAAYLGNQVGFVSKDTAEPTKWLAKKDPLRERWYDEKLELYQVESIHNNVDIETNRLHIDNQNLENKQEKIRSLQGKVREFSQLINRGEEENIHKTPLIANVDRIGHILNTASANVDTYQQLRTRNIQLFQTQQPAEFHAWLQARPDREVLLNPVHKERDDSLQDVPSFIIEDSTLQSLDNRITIMMNEPNLDYSTHFAMAEKLYKKEARKHLAAMSTFARDLFTPKNTHDYVTIVGGGLGLLGLMSIMSNNSTEIGKVACIGVGGVSSLVAKKLYYHFLFEGDMNTHLDTTQGNMNGATGRLELLRREIQNNVVNIEDRLKNEYEHELTRDNQSRLAEAHRNAELSNEARMITIQNSVQNAGIVAGRADATVTNLQNNVIPQLQNTMTNQHLTAMSVTQNIAQQVERRLDGMVQNQERLQKSVEDINQYLNKLSVKITVSQDQLCAWFNDEAKSRDDFESFLMKELGEFKWMQVKILLNTERISYLAEATAQHQHVPVKAIEASSWNNNSSMQQLVPAKTPALRRNALLLNNKYTERQKVKADMKKWNLDHYKTSNKASFGQMSSVNVSLFLDASCKNDQKKSSRKYYNEESELKFQNIPDPIKNEAARLVTAGVRMKIKQKD